MTKQEAYIVAVFRSEYVTKQDIEFYRIAAQALSDSINHVIRMKEKPRRLKGGRIGEKNEDRIV